MGLESTCAGSDAASAVYFSWVKGGKFEIDRDGLKGAENFSVHRGT
jgi:hypothetical protein